MSQSTSPQNAGHPATGAAAGRWVLDPAQSSVRFRSKTFWGMVTVKGTFGTVSGEGEVAADGSAHGTLTIDATSVDTKSAKRDTHLRSADFFNTDENPTFVFNATSVTPAEGDTVQISGDLTVNGVSRPLSFPAKVVSASAEEATLEAEAVVDQTEFGITWNQLGMMKAQVAVEISARYRHEG